MASRRPARKRRKGSGRAAAKGARRGGAGRGGRKSYVRRRGSRTGRLQQLRDGVERAIAVALLFCFVAGAVWVVLDSMEPPRDPEDICAVFRERPRWHDAARASAARWGVSEGALLAIVFQESSFRADARPPRRLWLGVLPGFRPSTAYGFGQVLDGTWQEYLDSEASVGARRNRMDDVLDFIGWYASVIERRAGVTRGSVRELYLAYHQGPAGYARGSHRGQAWLLRTADGVEARARRYEAQYAACRADLDRRSWLPFI